MFNFLVSINRKPTFAVKSFAELSAFFNYYQEELEVNKFEFEFNVFEVFPVNNISKEKAAQWLGTNDIIAALSKDGEVIAFGRYDESSDCDFFFPFNGEDEKRLNVDF